MIQEPFVNDQTITAEHISRLIDDRPNEGVFRIHRDVFRDERLFALEQKYIFEATWVFLGLAARAPQPHDFFTTTIGRFPVVVMRGGDGALRCVINSCRHKGALICRAQTGNRQVHTCPYHSWAYDSAGRNVGIKGRAAGKYGAGFDDDSHDLVAVPRFDEYRGFLFASMNPDVPPLLEHLGGTTAFIDLVIDQSPHGIEAVPGNVTFVYRGNWKMQLENCGDAYHFTSAHASYLRVLDRRASASGGQQTRIGKIFSSNTELNGMFGFRHGHSVLWTGPAAPERSPLYPIADQLRERIGATRTAWMFGVRNMTIFPNVQLADTAATIQLRILRPVSVNRTEMETYCLAPVGEDPEIRRRRIHQYEDFFNPTGLATPDDAVCYEDCQAGISGADDQWLQGYMRGLTILETQPNEQARELGIEPVAGSSGEFAVNDESIVHASYRQWRDMLRSGLEREHADSNGVRAR